MILNKIARIVSEIFNGFLLMVLIPSVAIAVSPILLTYKILFILLYVLVISIPFLILKKQGKISDYEFTKREERPIYFTIVTVGYLLLFVLSTLLKNTAITHVTLALFTSACILTIVTLYWKMSGHMTYSTLFFFTLIYLFPYIKYLPLLFLFTPLIAASRIILKKHTLLQTIIGTLVTAMISILIFWVL